MQYSRDYLRAATIGLFGAVNIGCGWWAASPPLAAGGALVLCFAVLLAARIHSIEQPAAGPSKSLAGAAAARDREDETVDPLCEAIKFRKQSLAEVAENEYGRSSRTAPWQPSSL
jgi:hypothetical protein